MKALQSGTIAAAGLDVYEFEPQAAEGLLALKNVVACPHIASATIDTRNKMAMIAAENITNVLSGRTTHNAGQPVILNLTRNCH